MSEPSAPLSLTAQLALLSLISFGGIPAVLPDLHNLVVVMKGWVTEREFADFFALARAMPGLPMLLMTSLIGWKVGGLAGSLAGAVATIGPSCGVAFAVFRLGHRFRDSEWQRIVLRGLVPVTVGIVTASGCVLALAAAKDWQAAATTAAAAGLMLGTRMNPLWILVLAGIIGGLGLI